MIPTKRSYLVFTGLLVFKMAPSQANKRRQNLTVKQDQLKKRKTRRPTSLEKLVVESRTVATPKKRWSLTVLMIKTSALVFDI